MLALQSFSLEQNGLLNRWCLKLDFSYPREGRSEPKGSTEGAPVATLDNSIKDLYISMAHLSIAHILLTLDRRQADPSNNLCRHAAVCKVARTGALFPVVVELTAGGKLDV